MQTKTQAQALVAMIIAALLGCGDEPTGPFDQIPEIEFTEIQGMSAKTVVIQITEPAATTIVVEKLNIEIDNPRSAPRAYFVEFPLTKQSEEYTIQVKATNNAGSTKEQRVIKTSALPEEPAPEPVILPPSITDIKVSFDGSVGTFTFTTSEIVKVEAYSLMKEDGQIWTFSGNTVATDTEGRLSMFYVQPGKDYRYRLIATSLTTGKVALVEGEFKTPPYAQPMQQIIALSFNGWRAKNTPEFAFTSQPAIENGTLYCQTFENGVWKIVSVTNIAGAAGLVQVAVPLRPMSTQTCYLEGNTYYSRSNDVSIGIGSEQRASVYLTYNSIPGGATNFHWETDRSVDYPALQCYSDRSADGVDPNSGLPAENISRGDMILRLARDADHRCQLEVIASDSGYRSKSNELHFYLPQ